ncbi:hypothetical protein AB2N08_13260 [Massilia aurea]|uniref:hypothetical protein n=1 Tax=Massilia aurea TaxID=373040 RepID=UPI0034622094
MNAMTLTRRLNVGLALLSVCLAGDAKEINPVSDFGALSETVAAAGTLIAAVGAVMLCWKGPFDWEPAEEDLPRSAQKVCSLLIGIAIAIIWFRFKNHTLTPDDLQTFSMALGAGVLIAFIVYSLLVSVYVYDIDRSASTNRTRIIKIIGGFWLTPRARRLMAGHPPANIPPGVTIPSPQTINDLLAGHQYKIDSVWSRLSRGLAKAAFQLAYIALVGCGTCALTTASILLAVTTA